MLSWIVVGVVAFIGFWILRWLELVERETKIMMETEC